MAKQAFLPITADVSRRMVADPSNNAVPDDDKREISL